MNSIKINYIVLSVIIIILVITIKSVICVENEEEVGDNFGSEDKMNGLDGNNKDKWRQTQVDFFNFKVRNLNNNIPKQIDSIISICNEELKTGGFTEEHDSREKALKFTFNNICTKLYNRTVNCFDSSTRYRIDAYFDGLLLYSCFDLKMASCECDFSNKNIKYIYILAEDITHKNGVSLKLYFEEIKDEIVSNCASYIDQNESLDPHIWCSHRNNGCIGELTQGLIGIELHANTMAILVHMYLEMTIATASTIGNYFKEYFEAMTVLLVNACARFISPPKSYCQNEKYKTTLKNYLDGFPSTSGYK